jgi:hypothetical protein
LLKFRSFWTKMHTPPFRSFLTAKTWSHEITWQNKGLLCDDRYNIVCGALCYQLQNKGFIHHIGILAPIYIDERYLMI